MERLDNPKRLTSRLTCHHVEPGAPLVLVIVDVPTETAPREGEMVSVFIEWRRSA